MRYINTFKSMTDFNKDKQTNLNQPRVALVKENGGGVDKLFYIKFKIYEFAFTTYINGMPGNQISTEDIPLKTSVRKIYNDETIQGTYINYDGTIEISTLPYPYAISTWFHNLTPHLTITSDSLDLIEYGRLVTKFTLTGLKRKDSDQRDFVGEIACYLDSNDQPILFKVDRTNPEHPTVSCISDFTQYRDNYEIENRIKGFIINNDPL